AVQQCVSIIRVYVTGAAGLPNAPSAFDHMASVSTSANPISVEAVGDNSHFIHVLAKLNNGELGDYPFDLNLGVFGPSVLLASGNPTVAGDYAGSSGVSAMLD